MVELQWEEIPVDLAIQETSTIERGEWARRFDRVLAGNVALRITCPDRLDASRKINLAYLAVKDDRCGDYQERIELRRRGNVIYVLPAPGLPRTSKTTRPAPVVAVST